MIYARIKGAELSPHIAAAAKLQPGLKNIGRLNDGRIVAINERRQLPEASMLLYRGHLIAADSAVENVVVKIAPDRSSAVEVQSETYFLQKLEGVPGFPRISGQGKVEIEGKGEQPFFVMPEINGISLGCLALPEWRGQLPSREEISLLTESVLPGLAARLGDLHARQIVHRDVKPNNALYRGQGEVVLLDFGRANGLNSPARTDTGAVGFYPPEMAFALYLQEDVRTDVYGLGTSALTLIAGVNGLLYEGMDDPWRYTGLDRLMMLMTREKMIENYYRAISAREHFSVESVARQSNLPAELKETPLGRYLASLFHPDKAQRPFNLPEIADRLKALGGQFASYELQSVEAE
ncbi:MAG: hypothetical protein WC529_03765 [Candidatus Margulisiibacteriota bacterium]